MGSRWSVDQVMAAAPDSSSQVAGRRLARPGPWSSIGFSGGLLWGECQGSGRTPYRVTVDTGTRRYQCSCPSRKFPCKHALGLLFLWAEGTITDSGEIAGFAKDFAVRGQATEGGDGGDRKLKEQTAAQKAATAARAAERERRVEGGLFELDRWLADQVSGGLARAAQDPYGWCEPTAARMVDAQAPGVAAWLRRLPALIAAGPGWPARLLDELGLLHLLARGYLHRAQLPDDLVATVRDHVGFTVPRAEVLTRPPVRDHWVVVGFRDLDTETVSTRRVWLRGNASGRWAQVLFFAAGGAALDSSLIPATVLDADLHFYPGRAGLRAAVGIPHADAVPATGWRPTVDTVAVAADRWAEALAADPWQHQIPVVLRGLVDNDERGWTLTDPEGEAIAVQGTDLDLWRLLALTAGMAADARTDAPIDIAGEWSPTGFRPATAVLGGQMVVL
ncbi:MAG TPA: SWIM zinc finger family protein [Nakamurella sp.]